MWKKHLQIKTIFIWKKFLCIFVVIYGLDFIFIKHCRQIYEHLKKYPKLLVCFHHDIKIDIIYPIKLPSNAKLKLKHQISYKQV